MTKRDELTVTVNKRGDITIRLPGPVLRTAAAYCDHFPEGTRVTNTLTFAKEVVSALTDEDEMGDNHLTRAIDDAMNDAAEYGAEGIKLGDEDE